MSNFTFEGRCLLKCEDGTTYITYLPIREIQDFGIIETWGKSFVFRSFGRNDSLGVYVAEFEEAQILKLNSDAAILSARKPKR